MTRRLRYVAVVMCVCSGVTASAQSLGELARKTEEKRKTDPKATSIYTARDVDTDASAREVVNYEITPERWRLFKAADAAIMRALEKDPALFDRSVSLKMETVSTLERFLTREPALSAAVASASTTARDHATTQVALSAALIVAQHPRFSELYGQLSPAMRTNVDFVRAHEAELRTMQTQFLALRARMGR
jgi:hypothetical protein